MPGYRTHLPVLCLGAVNALAMERLVAIYMRMDKVLTKEQAHAKQDNSEGQRQ